MKLKIISPNSQAGDVVFAALAAVIGLLVRLPAPLRASFPLNDGGLFYQMILDLQHSGFRLPEFSTYNTGGIPFAYPPLAFYVTGFVSSALHLDVISLLRIVPPVISALCVAAFYYLARRVLAPRQETAMAATVAFALIPRGFEWQIMGGGITRSFGLLFALLTLRAMYVMLSEHRARDMIAVVLCGSLTVLSHPEAAAQTALAALILFLVLDHSRRGTVYAAICGVGIALLSAPWWASVLLHHGISPFLAAAAAARAGTYVDLPGRIFLTFRFQFTDESFLPLIAIVGLLGLFAELGRSQFLLPLWVTAPLFFEPRSAPQFMVIPLGMLAGIGLMDVLLPFFTSLATKTSRSALLATRGFFVYLFLYCLLSAYLVPFGISNGSSLHGPELAALGWVRDQTPADSRFILLTGYGAVSDPVADWFPALTGRRSLNTLFGLEWVESVSLRKGIEQYDALQGCLGQDESCLSAWAKENELPFTHILLEKKAAGPLLLATLQKSADYELVYENVSVAIFALKTPAPTG